MRKLMAVAVILALIIPMAGCGGSIGTGLSNTLGNIQGKLCNPSAQAKAEMAAAANFINAGLAAGAVITGHPELAMIDAAAILNGAVNTGCVVATDLQAVIAYVDAMETQSQNTSAVAAASKAIAPNPMPTLTTTRAWLGNYKPLL